MDEFIENLCDEEKNNVKESGSQEMFTFGDGSTVKSLKKVSFPCWINGKRGFTTTDVVECGIPLLLSRRTLKTLKMVLDFENDTVELLTHALSSSIWAHESIIVFISHQVEPTWI